MQPKEVFAGRSVTWTIRRHICLPGIWFTLVAHVVLCLVRGAIWGRVVKGFSRVMVRRCFGRVNKNIEIERLNGPIFISQSNDIGHQNRQFNLENDKIAFFSG